MLLSPFSVTFRAEPRSMALAMLVPALQKPRGEKKLHFCTSAASSGLQLLQLLQLLLALLPVHSLLS